MNRIKLLRVLCCTGILITLIGCAAPTVQFEVTAPGAYSGKVPASMELGQFTSNRGSYGSVFSREVAVRVTREGFIKILNTGAEAILSGNIAIGDFVDNSWSSSFACDEYQGKNKPPIHKTCTIYSYSKKTDISVQFTMSDKKGVILVSNSAISRYNQTFSGNNAGEARSSAPTNDQIINNSMANLAESVLQVISPHKMTVTRELRKGDDNLELGIKYAQNGRLDQAMGIWDQSTNSSNPKVRAAAYYNMGVIKGANGQYVDAFELFSKADKTLPGDDLYIKSMTEAESFAELRQKLDRQMH